MDSNKTANLEDIDKNMVIKELFIACSKGDLSKIKEVILPMILNSKYADDIINSYYYQHNSIAEFNGLTPLILATFEGHQSIVKVLLENGADIKQKAKDPDNPNNFNYIEDYPALFIACYYGYSEIVENILLFSNNRHDKSEIINQYLTSGFNPLLVAADQGHADIVNLLLKSGADVNCSTKTTNDNEKSIHSGESALLLACANNHIEVIRNILTYCHNKGLDIVNKARSDGLTPLLYAAQKGYADIAEILLEYGADLVTKLHSHPHSTHNIYINSSLHLACLKKNPNIINQTGSHLKTVAVLLRHAYKNNLSLIQLNQTQENHASPFAAALFSNNLDLIRLFLCSGANISILKKQNKIDFDYFFTALANERLSRLFLIYDEFFIIESGKSLLDNIENFKTFFRENGYVLNDKKEDFLKKLVQTNKTINYFKNIKNTQLEELEFTTSFRFTNGYDFFKKILAKLKELNIESYVNSYSFSDLEIVFFRTNQHIFNYLHEFHNIIHIANSNKDYHFIDINNLNELFELFNKSDFASIAQDNDKISQEEISPLAQTLKNTQEAIFLENKRELDQAITALINNDHESYNEIKKQIILPLLDSTANFLAHKYFRDNYRIYLINSNDNNVSAEEFYLEFSSNVFNYLLLEKLNELETKLQPESTSKEIEDSDITNPRSIPSNQQTNLDNLYLYMFILGSSSSLIFTLFYFLTQENDLYDFFKTEREEDNFRFLEI